jgi:predicted RNase H-like nuclease
LTVRVVGVDACRAGWVAVVLADRAVESCTVHADIAGVAASCGPVDGFGIDIPIGLPDNGRRQADVLARERVGRRLNSVFFTPCRQVLESATHREATTLSVQLGGVGVSAQTYALAKKILEVDAWRPLAAAPVWEVHPELSFAILAGTPLPYPKTRFAGVQMRRELLRGAGVDFDGPLLPGGASADTDDVLDAVVAAWSAERAARGAAVCLPDPPEALDGIPAAIWA